MEATKIIEGASGQLLKAIEVANILNISEAFAYRLMQTGEIRSVRLNRVRRVRLEDLEEYITANLNPPNKF